MKNAYRPCYPSDVHSEWRDQQGLTKRELFAAMALQGYVASPDTTDATYTDMAQDAVAAADALLAALESTP